MGDNHTYRAERMLDAGERSLGKFRNIDVVSKPIPGIDLPSATPARSEASISTEFVVSFAPLNNSHFASSEMASVQAAELTIGRVWLSWSAGKLPQNT
jgi:hypothetical protein